MIINKIFSVLCASIFVYARSSFLCRMFLWKHGWLGILRSAISLFSMILLTAQDRLATPCIFCFAWVFVDIAMADEGRLCYYCTNPPMHFIFSLLSYELFVLILWRKTNYSQLIAFTAGLTTLVAVSNYLIDSTDTQMLINLALAVCTLKAGLSM